MFSENQLSALCQESGLQQIFQSREEAMYLIRVVDSTRKSLFLVDIPSNSLPQLEEIQKIIVQIFILLTI